MSVGFSVDLEGARARTNADQSRHHAEGGLLGLLRVEEGVVEVEKDRADGPHGGCRRYFARYVMKPFLRS